MDVRRRPVGNHRPGIACLCCCQPSQNGIRLTLLMDIGDQFDDILAIRNRLAGPTATIPDEAQFGGLAGHHRGGTGFAVDQNSGCRRTNLQAVLRQRSTAQFRRLDRCHDQGIGSLRHRRIDDVGVRRQIDPCRTMAILAVAGMAGMLPRPHPAGCQPGQYNTRNSRHFVSPLEVMIRHRDTTQTTATRVRRLPPMRVMTCVTKPRPGSRARVYSVAASAEASLACVGFTTTTTCCGRPPCPAACVPLARLTLRFYWAVAPHVSTGYADCGPVIESVPEVVNEDPGSIMVRTGRVRQRSACLIVRA